jgi:hypothetical protein
VVAFANELIVNVAPSTVGNYLSHLGAVFAVARPAWAYPLDPTIEELDKILEYFGERLKRRPSSIPMQKIIGFAIFSTRRLEEITRISWKNSMGKEAVF